MRDTFFREQSENFELNESSEQMKFPELYGLQEETMKPVDIKDPEVTNCEHPYSYGDVNEISKGLDYIQGDIGMSAGGTCVLTTISNILRECGDYTHGEKEVAEWSKIQGLSCWDIEAPEHLRGGTPIENIPKIFEDLSDGIKLELTSEQEKNLTPEWVAEKLDHGYRGGAVFSSGLLWETEPLKTKAGTISDAIPLKPVSEFIDSHWHKYYADHAVTFECAVRDKETGNPVGFYICDSGNRQLKRYITVEQFENVFHTKQGTVFFTQKPVLKEHEKYSRSTEKNNIKVSDEKNRKNASGKTMEGSSGTWEIKDPKVETRERMEQEGKPPENRTHLSAREALQKPLEYWMKLSENSELDKENTYKCREYAQYLELKNKTEQIVLEMQAAREQKNEKQYDALNKEYHDLVKKEHEKKREWEFHYASRSGRNISFL